MIQAVVDLLKMIGRPASIYAVLFLLPFGAGWMVTFVLLRRTLGR